MFAEEEYPNTLEQNLMVSAGPRTYLAETFGQETFNERQSYDEC
jgi:hypothetical protein